MGRNAKAAVERAASGVTCGSARGTHILGLDKNLYRSGYAFTQRQAGHPVAIAYVSQLDSNAVDEVLHATACFHLHCGHEHFQRSPQSMRCIQTDWTCKRPDWKGHPPRRGLAKQRRRLWWRRRISRRLDCGDRSVKKKISQAIRRQEKKNHRIRCDFMTGSRMLLSMWNYLQLFAIICHNLQLICNHMQHFGTYTICNCFRLSDIHLLVATNS